MRTRQEDGASRLVLREEALWLTEACLRPHGGGRCLQSTLLLVRESWVCTLLGQESIQRAGLPCAGDCTLKCPKGHAIFSRRLLLGQAPAVAVAVEHTMHSGFEAVLDLTATAPSRSLNTVRRKRCKVSIGGHTSQGSTLVPHEAKQRSIPRRGWGRDTLGAPAGTQLGLPATARRRAIPLHD